MFIEDKAVDTLAHLSDGDARAGLNGLQLAVLARLSARKVFGKKTGQTYPPGRVLVTEGDVKEGLQRSHILYDRAGEWPWQAGSRCGRCPPLGAGFRALATGPPGREVRVSPCPWSAGTWQAVWSVITSRGKLL